MRKLVFITLSLVWIYPAYSLDCRDDIPSWTEKAESCEIVKDGELFDKYIIWGGDFEGYWIDRWKGYTRDIKEAALYDKDYALSCVVDYSMIAPVGFKLIPVKCLGPVS